jgi:hypothetical protein
VRAGHSAGGGAWSGRGALEQNLRTLHKWSSVFALKSEPMPARSREIRRPARFLLGSDDESDGGYQCEMKCMPLSNIAIQYHVFVTTSCYHSRKGDCYGDGEGKGEGE